MLRFSGWSPHNFGSHLGYVAVLSGGNDARNSRKDITSHRLYREVKATGYPAILPNYTASFSGRLCYGTRQGSFHLQVFRKVRPQVNEIPQGQRIVKIQVFVRTSVRNRIPTFRKNKETILSETSDVHYPMTKHSISEQANAQMNMLYSCRFASGR
jgi:hypothetical protein